MLPTEEQIKGYHPHCGYYKCDKPLGWADEEAAHAAGDTWLCPAHYEQFRREIALMESSEDLSTRITLID